MLPLLATTWSMDLKQQWSAGSKVRHMFLVWAAAWGCCLRAVQN